MNVKQDLLDQITNLAKVDEITEQEVINAVRAGHNDGRPATEVVNLEQTVDSTAQPLKHESTATSVLFAVGAVLLYVGMLVFAFQIPGDADLFRNSFLLVSGFTFWLLAWWLLKNSQDNERADGIGEALLLTGSLSIITGSYVALGEIFFDSASSSEAAFINMFILATLASLHYGLDFILRRTVLIGLAAILSVGTYLSLVFAIFSNAISSSDFWIFVMLTVGTLFIGFGSLFAKGKPDRQFLRAPFWGVGGFIILSTAFGALSASSFGILWEVIFPAMLYGAFMLSIKFKNKSFLASGAFFLFAYVLYLSFKYFGEGLGAGAALILGGLLVIGSGVFVLDLKKKYF